MRPFDFKPRRRVRDTVLLSGWLFADLLLALVILFMAANTVGVKPQPLVTPTPTPKLVTPTPERLEFQPHSITLQNVDFNGLLNNSPQVIKDVKQRIQSQSVLHGRSVGLAIVYGGAPTDNDIRQAQQIANQIRDAILKPLGQQGFAFQRASYYGPLYVLPGVLSNVDIDVYLFKQ